MSPTRTLVNAAAHTLCAFVVLLLCSSGARGQDDSASRASGTRLGDAPLRLVGAELDYGLFSYGVAARGVYAPPRWPLALFARAGLWGYGELLGEAGHGALLEPGIALTAQAGAFTVLVGGGYGAALLGKERCPVLGSDCTRSSPALTSSASAGVDLLYRRSPDAWFAGANGGARFVRGGVWPFMGGTFGRSF